MIQIEAFTAESSGVAARSAALFETKSCEHFVLNLGFISRPLNRRASAVGPVEIMEVKGLPRRFVRDAGQLIAANFRRLRTLGFVYFKLLGVAQNQRPSANKRFARENRLVADRRIYSEKTMWLNRTRA